MLDLLLRNGADPSQLTKEGDTPLELALRMGHAEAADLLKRARMSTGEVRPVEVAPVTQAGG
jgi:ankyrin repeat protein